MSVIITNMDMPKSCYDCWLKRSCKNAHVNGWLCNRRDDDCPLKSTDEMIAEIGVCKTENEMRIAERDYKSRLWISGIFSEVISIIHKYCDKEQKDGRNS